MLLEERTTAEATVIGTGAVGATNEVSGLAAVKLEPPNTFREGIPISPSPPPRPSSPESTASAMTTSCRTTSIAHAVTTTLVGSMVSSGRGPVVKAATEQTAGLVVGSGSKRRREGG